MELQTRIIKLKEQIINNGYDVEECLLKIKQFEIGLSYGNPILESLFTRFEIKYNLNTLTKNNMDIELELNRIYFSPTYTIGKLFVEGKLWCDTIEDVNRDLNKDGDLKDIGETKVMHKTAIPFGRYEVVVNMSTKFKRMLPRLLNVPHFDGILIHNGVDETSSSGCIIVGENKEKGKVLNSRFWMNKLTDYLLEKQQKSNKIYITIK